ncbi:19818_t:CDS:2, partial [Funneliformis geosporum]
AQLITMYQRPGFESLLKKCTNQDDTELITDIYEGEIWKTFPLQIDTPDSSCGIIYGPKEVKLHRINHYLSPIVDELLELWNGY